MNPELYIPEPNTGCWLWLGNVSGRGYGRIQAGGKSRAAHRVAYEEATGTKIPFGMLCDHKCRNRLCVNPGHLRIVTNKINTLENSVAPTAINKLKTHCVNGHEFTMHNTRLRVRNGSERRECRTCQLMHDRAYKKRRALAQASKP